VQCSCTRDKCIGISIRAIHHDDGLIYLGRARGVAYTARARPRIHDCCRAGYNGPAKTALPLCSLYTPPPPLPHRSGPGSSPSPHPHTSPHGRRVNGTPLKRAGLTPPLPTLFRSLYRAPVLQRTRCRPNSNSARTSSSRVILAFSPTCVRIACINIHICIIILLLHYT